VEDQESRGPEKSDARENCTAPENDPTTVEEAMDREDAEL